MGIIPVEPRGSKESRVNSISFAIEAGNVYLPSNKRFTNEFIEECSQFPNGKHDDMVDSMSMALMKLIWSPTKKKLVLPKKQWWESGISKENAVGKGVKLNVI